jgi:hypothetical protein
MAVAVKQFKDVERTAFNRESSGLVDLGDYIPYFVDPPGAVPTRPDVGSTAYNRFVHQHEYFIEPLYLQLDLPRRHRDRRFAALRNSYYSQIIMRDYKEKEMHFEKEQSVQPPSIETIDKTLLDYFDIDIVGATTYAIHELSSAKRQSTWEEQHYTPPPEIESLSKRDKMKILITKRRQALEALASPRVIPEYLVTSALKRLGTSLRDYELNREADSRLEKDGFYFPLGVPKAGHFRCIAGMILGDEVGLRPLEESRIIIQRLQPLEEVAA